jgi:hypothetical protein
LADTAEAVERLEAVIAHPALEPMDVIRTANLLGNVYLQYMAWERAATSYKAGLRAIDDLYRLQPSLAGREVWLGQAPSLHHRAAFALAKDGQLEAAVVTLERSRARALSEAIGQLPSDLEDRLGSGHRAAYERYRAAADRAAALAHDQRKSGRAPEGPTRKVIEARPDVLLSDAMDAVLSQFILQYSGDAAAVRVLEEHRHLLRRCRREGIEAAFADLLRPPSRRSRRTCLSGRGRPRRPPGVARRISPLAGNCLRDSGTTDVVRSSLSRRRRGSRSMKS